MGLIIAFCAISVVNPPAMSTMDRARELARTCAAVVAAVVTLALAATAIPARLTLKRSGT